MCASSLCCVEGAEKASILHALAASSTTIDDIHRPLVYAGYRIADTPALRQCCVTPSAVSNLSFAESLGEPHFNDRTPGSIHGV